MLIKRISGAAVLASALILSSCGGASADPRMVSEWMHALYGVIRIERLSPPVASRVLTYASAALYSGMAAANPKMKAIVGLNGFPELQSGVKGLDETVTAVAAERVVLDSLFDDGLPTSRAALSRLADSLINDRVGRVSSEVMQQSRAAGASVGLAIVAWAHSDGFDGTRGKPFVPPVGIGLWINDSPTQTFTSTNLSATSTSIDFNNPANVSKSPNASDRSLIMSPPKRGGKTTLPGLNMTGVTEPYWGTLRPFALTKWDECQTDPAPMYGRVPGTPLYDQAKMVFDVKKNLTPEQKEVALYWADNPGESGTPTGHWLSIAAQIIAERKLNGEEAARIMVTTSVSLADAFIAAWGYKFQYNLIRPRSFIRIVMDSTWEPAIPTPPFPEYLSGHSTVSAAAATALTALLGATPFSDSTSVALGHAVRHFESFQAAADEAGQSRVYGGIHYPVANEAGKALGRCIGAKVVERLGGR